MITIQAELKSVIIVVKDVLSHYVCCSGCNKLLRLLFGPYPHSLHLYNS